MAGFFSIVRFQLKQHFLAASSHSEGAPHPCPPAHRPLACCLTLRRGCGVSRPGTARGGAGIGTVSGPQDPRRAEPGGRGAQCAAGARRRGQPESGYFTRVSSRDRGGQREREQRGHQGEHGDAAPQAPGAPRSLSGCPPPGRVPAVSMETHEPAETEGGQGGPKDTRSSELPGRKVSTAGPVASPPSGLGVPRLDRNSVPQSGRKGKTKPRETRLWGLSGGVPRTVVCRVKSQSLKLVLQEGNPPCGEHKFVISMVIPPHTR